MGLIIGCLFVAWQVSAHEHKEDLPAGPIRDRHALMEEIGDHAKKIGGALKQGTTEGVAAEADGISVEAKKINALFPKGSTDPKSRALPAIWENWDKFVELAKQLETTSQSLSSAAAASDDEDLKEKSQKVFATCKSCHDQFRKPEEKK
jgi:cytochrome c556